LLGRLRRSARYRLGLHVVAPPLESGTDAGVVEYYNSRPSRCSFLQDPQHYERPRVNWILDAVRGGRALEIGCADGGFSFLLADQVASLHALDICRASVDELVSRHLPNVVGHVGLVEEFHPPDRFDWIVMSEFLEHVRDPESVVSRSLQWLAPGGRLLASSPDGPWEADSIEHLHVFDLRSWAQLFSVSPVQSLRAFRIRDAAGGNRWLGADVAVA
jgi:2-polyprenyl-3-methyl-5-hydroxy-6-metoxy-1,4-benzoquinol methylase